MAEVCRERPNPEQSFHDVEQANPNPTMFPWQQSGQYLVDEDSRVQPIGGGVGQFSRPSDGGVSASRLMLPPPPAGSMQAGGSSGSTSRALPPPPPMTALPPPPATATPPRSATPPPRHQAPMEAAGLRALPAPPTAGSLRSDHDAQRDGQGAATGLLEMLDCGIVSCGGPERSSRERDEVVQQRSISLEDQSNRELRASSPSRDRQASPTMVKFAEAHSERSAQSREREPSTSTFASGNIMPSFSGKTLGAVMSVFAVLLCCVLLLVAWKRKPVLTQGAFAYTTAIPQNNTILLGRFQQAMMLTVRKVNVPEEKEKQNQTTSSDGLGYTYRQVEILYQERQEGEDVLSHSMLYEVLKIEESLRELPSWQRLCGEQVPVDHRSLCQPGDSMAAAYFAKRSVATDADLAKGVIASFAFDGTGILPVMSLDMFLNYLEARAPDNLKRWVPPKKNGNVDRSTVRSTFVFYLPNTAIDYWDQFVQDELDPLLWNLAMKADSQSREQQYHGPRLFYRIDGTVSREFERSAMIDFSLVVVAPALSAMATLVVTKRLVLALAVLIIAVGAPTLATLLSAELVLHYGAFSLAPESERYPEVNVLSFAAAFATAASCADLAIATQRAWSNMRIVWPWWLSELNLYLHNRQQRKREARRNREVRRLQDELDRLREEHQQARDQRRMIRQASLQVSDESDSDDSTVSVVSESSEDSRKPQPGLKQSTTLSSFGKSNSSASLGADRRKLFLSKKSGSAMDSTMNSKDNMRLNRMASIESWLTESGADEQITVKCGGCEQPCTAPEGTVMLKCPACGLVNQLPPSKDELEKEKENQETWLVRKVPRMKRLLRFYWYFAEACVPPLTTALMLLLFAVVGDGVTFIPEFSLPAGLGMFFAVTFGMALFPAAVELGEFLHEESEVSDAIDAFRNSCCHTCLVHECGGTSSWRQGLDTGVFRLTTLLEGRAFRTVTLIFSIVMAFTVILWDEAPRFSVAMPELFAEGHRMRDAAAAQMLFQERVTISSILETYPETAHQCLVTAGDSEDCSWSQCEVNPKIKVKAGECRCFTRMSKPREGDPCDAAARLWFTQDVANPAPPPEDFLESRFWPWLEDQVKVTLGAGKGASSEPKFAKRAFFVEMEDWESGTAFTNQQVSTALPAMRNLSMPLYENACLRALCFCGRHVCRLPENQDWKDMGTVSHRDPEPSRRLQPTEWSQEVVALPDERRSSWRTVGLPDASLQAAVVPQWSLPSRGHGRRLLYDFAAPLTQEVYITWGLELSVEPSLKAVPSNPDFNSVFQIENPWTQRNILSFCEGVAPDLEVVSMNCWPADFKRWLTGNRKRYPLRETEFYPEFLAFLETVSDDTNYNLFWVNMDGKIMATYLAFQVLKQDNDEKNAELLEAWESFLAFRNMVAAKTAGNATMISPLLVGSQELDALKQSVLLVVCIALAVPGGVTLCLTCSPGLMLLIVGALFLALLYLVVLVVGIGGRPVGALEAASLAAFMAYLVSPLLRVAQQYAFSPEGPGENPDELERKRREGLRSLKSTDDLGSAFRPRSHSIGEGESGAGGKGATPAPFQREVPLWDGAVQAERRARTAFALRTAGEAVLGGSLSMFLTGMALFASHMQAMSQVGVALLGCATTALPLTLGVLPIMLLLGAGPSMVKMKAFYELARDVFRSQERSGPANNIVQWKDGKLNLGNMMAPDIVQAEMMERPQILRSVSVIESKHSNMLPKSLAAKAQVVIGGAGHVLGGLGSVLGAGQALDVLDGSASRQAERRPAGGLSPEGERAAAVLGGYRNSWRGLAMCALRLRRRLFRDTEKEEESEEDDEEGPRIFTLDVQGATARPPFHVVLATQAGVSAAG
eukprot:TRINITY_DN4564_c0_g2_i1.p1 TRINITY_DN4564_c0_g2~~TRINITY_DN4564_c0_g2_i1.p1  ORF type:complete len:1850 (+),score=457.64 TRINITY_DN4564_c0_g2_i1:296-5845(+)